MNADHVEPPSRAYRVDAANGLEAVPREFRRERCPELSDSATFSQYFRARIHGLRESIIVREVDDRGCPRCPLGASSALLAVAVCLLLASLLGHAWAVLGFCVIVAVAAYGKIRHRGLLVGSASALVANTLFAPRILGSATDASAWVWVALWCTEGLLINWLVVEILRGIGPGPATGESAEARVDGPPLIPTDLLVESSTQSLERFRLMVESIVDHAIVMLGPDGRVTSWNLGAERIFQYSAREVLGQSVSLFYLPADVRSGTPHGDLQAALAHGNWEFEGWRRRRDESRLWAHVGITPMRNPAGTFLGFATVVRDCTERRRAEESVRQARDELEIRVRDRTAELAAANQALQAEVRERVQAQEVLLKQSGVLRSILDSVGDAIVVVEGLDRPLTFNPAARELFGVEREPTSLAEWLSLVRFGVGASDSDPAAREHGPFERALRGEEFDDLELVVRRPRSDRVRWVQANARPLRDRDGRDRGAVVAFRDVTERRRHLQEVKLAKEAAESASTAKDRFLAMLSHELRTPLTPVLLGASELLDRPDVSPEARSTLAMMDRNARLEARLIDDLLDLTRATSGHLHLSLASIDMHRVIEDAIEICRAAIAEAGLEVTLDLDARDHYVQGDATRLQQVFWNLVKNATKFTPPGGKITIRTRSMTSDLAAGGSTFRAEVTDTGLGIEGDRLARIFNAFEERDERRRRIPGGLGLGLAISRSVILAHGGSLTAASEGANLGATFTVELAALPITGLEAPAGDDQGHQACPPALRILLVDDNRDTLQSLARLLEQSCHRVDPATSCREASRLARLANYDLLISDIDLPDGTGLEVIREMRRRSPTPGIAVSGFGSADDIDMSLKSGFAEHLVKPIDVRTLNAAIARVATKPPDRAPPASSAPRDLRR
jgi:PAS domain S-box-containing protein